MVISSAAAWTGLPTSALASASATGSIAPPGQTPRCCSPWRPRSCTVLSSPGRATWMLTAGCSLLCRHPLEFFPGDGAEAHAVARREQARTEAPGVEHGERSTADHVPAAGDRIGIDHRLLIGDRHGAGWYLGARRCAPRHGEARVEPAPV